MIRWPVVRLPVVCVLVVSGCWTDDDLVDGQFTPDQWAHLQAELAVGTPRSVNVQLAALGQQLFYNPNLSGPMGTVSCATCHDPKAWFIDSRSPNNVSLGNTKYTKHNSISVVNEWLKEKYAPGQQVYTEIGGFVRTSGEIVTFTNAGQVAELAVTGPMASNHANVATAITSDGSLAMSYIAAFGGTSDPDTMFVNVEKAFDEYLYELSSSSSPFDKYIAGNDTAISDSAKRGFGVFVGKGMCIECHRGPALSDFLYHDTGVEQIGAHVPTTDVGRGAITKNPDDTGAFLTSPLRQIAETGPYMHDGSLGSLAEVIEFYRHGGAASGYSGDKDPRMVPSEMTDDDANDLEAFLRTLTGDPIPQNLRCASGQCAP